MLLDSSAARRFAKLALDGVRREYPNKLDHVLNGPDDVRSPRALHPAFYGCFDWHSSVHGHWLLARLLKTFPDLPGAADALDENLAAENVAAEARYFDGTNRQSFERTYGWAWLLALAAELRGSRWSVQPVADVVVQRFRAFLPKQTYPIRTGVHPNTAFSLSLALEYAQGDFRRLLEERGRAYFGSDRGAPLSWEPGGEDFVSPVLEEAALMSRVLPRDDFRRWFAAFLPGGVALTPAIVSDRHDPKIVHLDGLNLSRAAALYRLAQVLEEPRLAELADAHVQASLPHVTSGSYEGEHWLATYAVRALDARAEALR